MPTDPNMTGLIYPTEDGDEDVWDTILNTTVFPVIGAHDHTTGKGVKVPTTGLNINADLAFGSFSITGMKALGFTPVAASGITSYSSAFFVNSSDSNNLYFRNASGTNVKLTDGSTLNVSIVGGIGGDYSSVSALLDYDDASDTYRFRQETSASVRQYAKISTADLIIREYDAAGDATVPTETITIKSPDALAAGYTVTLPTAVPVAQSMVQMSTAGVLTTSNTLAADQSVTVSGTGDHKHGEKKWIVPFGAAAHATTGTLTFGSFASAFAWQLSASGVVVAYVPGLRSGWRIKSVSFVYNSAGTPVPGLAIQQYDGDASVSTTDTDVGGVYTMTIDGGGHTIGTAGDGPDLLRVEATCASTVDFTDLTVTFDIP